MIIQIVPRIPPAIDGVGDYSLNLARQFRKDFGIETCFLVGLSTWSGADEIEGFSVLQVKERSSAALFSLLSEHSVSTILLHYVGYGYAKRGCPLWLADGLQRWKIHNPCSRIVTMFHEVYASGPPWASSFWLSPLQKQIAGQLVKMSDRILTSNQFMAGSLNQLMTRQDTTISILPVFSSIGESQSLPVLSMRNRQLVVFGNRNNRLQVYQQCQVALEQICRSLRIETICDIGNPTGLAISHFNGIPVIEKGIIDASEISHILASSVSGFLNFPPPSFLAKSTIFAAYCAHGVVPCMVNFSSDCIDGLVGGTHYWSTAALDNSLLNLDTGKTIANSAYAWYQAHCLTVQAKIFRESLH